MKNKLFEEEKPFFLGYLIFGTFMKRWPDRLKVLQKRKEENPVIADEIDAAIKKTEASMAEFKDAAEKYKAAAKKAKEQYDNQSGVKGKVKGFFGLEQADPDKKIFDLSPIPSPMFVFTGGAEGPKIGGEKFSMNDILSPDFNIGLFHKRGKLEGELLKKKVLGELFSFREYYDPKSSSKISNEEIEGIQDETLDTFNPFEVFNPAQQESLIKHESTTLESLVVLSKPFLLLAGFYCLLLNYISCMKSQCLSKTSLHHETLELYDPLLIRCRRKVWYNIDKYFYLAKPHSFCYKKMS